MLENCVQTYIDVSLGVTKLPTKSLSIVLLFICKETSVVLRILSTSDFHFAKKGKHSPLGRHIADQTLCERGTNTAPARPSNPSRPALGQLSAISEAA